MSAWTDKLLNDSGFVESEKLLMAMDLDDLSKRGWVKTAGPFAAFLLTHLDPEVFRSENNSVEYIFADKKGIIAKKFDQKGYDKAVKSLRTKTEIITKNFPSDATFFVDQFGDPFYWGPVNNHRETLRVRSRAFKRIMTSWLLDASKNPTTNALSEMLATAEALAIKSNLQYDLHVRACRDAEGAVLIDLGNSTWDLIRITSNGWEILKDGMSTRPYFRRYGHMQEIAVGRSSRDAFMNIRSRFNLLESDLVLNDALIVCRLIPGFPHFGIFLTGPQGSCKSTFARLNRRLCDPSAIDLCSLPSKYEATAQLLQHHYIGSFDNVDSMQSWQSDLLARAITGEGMPKRELYSDDDDVVYRYMRSVIVNGIAPSGAKPDLIDRCLWFQLIRLLETSRAAEEDVLSRFEANLPDAMAYLFDMVSTTLRIRVTVTKELQGRLPRMADAAIFGEAASRALGYPDFKFFDLLRSRTTAASRMAIEDSLLGGVILSFCESLTNSWEGQPNEFLTSLNSLALNANVDTKQRGWPKSAHILRRRLEILVTPLRELGFAIEFAHTGKQRLVVVRRIALVPLSPALNDGKGLNRDAVSVASPDQSSVKDQSSVIGSVSKKSDDNNASDATNATLHTPLDEIIYKMNHEEIE